MDPSPKPPHLPFELWLQIIQATATLPDNLARTWLDCRLVSRFFKQATEETFLLYHMREMWVEMTLGIWEVDNNEDDYDTGVVFKRLSPDGSRAVFGGGWNVLPGDESDEDHCTWRPVLVPAYVKDGFGCGFTGLDGCPPHIIRLGDLVGGTPLIGLEIDCFAKEISVLWRETMGAFLRDQVRLQMLRDWRDGKSMRDDGQEERSLLYLDSPTSVAVDITCT
ncbi:hypothetical protein B0T19DRAFT_420262 [Cercophora scortea]|uniref:F-box domain-containing protein n=1 Tax=Cercophora scortea TaxID=314031 RepID=A0AAE0MIT0_9PEZI|nr:hypothetical protein B0T19DRAFT_420262 [Cercophora scortea]